MPELDSRWRVSSRSGQNGQCVEVCFDDSVIKVRDTKQNGQGPILEFTPDDWSVFTKSPKAAG